MAHKAKASHNHIKTNCDACGSEIRLYPSHYNEDGDNFCDKTCYRDHQKQNRKTTIESCSNCGGDVEVWPSQKHLENHYCDINCLSEDWSESIGLECDNCGSDIQRQPSKTDPYSNHFCSSGCHDEFRQNGEELECDNCGDPVYRTPSQKAERCFCSVDCRIEHQNGENHWNWDSEFVKCWWCGDKKAWQKSLLNRSERYFCDPQCHGRWKSWNNVHPQDPEPDIDMPKWKWDELQI